VTGCDALRIRLRLVQVSEPLIQRYEHHGFTGWYLPLGGTNESRAIFQIIRTESEKLYRPREFTVTSFSPVCRRLGKQKSGINETPLE
jgi:hypothetical protein